MESTNLKDILSYIVENLVEDPSAISIEAVEQDDTITFQLKVAESDMGKVIGRQGRIAKEIRTIIKSVAQRKGQRVNVEIIG